MATTDDLMRNEVQEGQRAMARGDAPVIDGDEIRPILAAAARDKSALQFVRTRNGLYQAQVGDKQVEFVLTREALAQVEASGRLGTPAAASAGRDASTTDFTDVATNNRRDGMAERMEKAFGARDSHVKHVSPGAAPQIQSGSYKIILDLDPNLSQQQVGRIIDERLVGLRNHMGLSKDDVGFSEEYGALTPNNWTGKGQLVLTVKDGPNSERVLHTLEQHRAQLQAAVTTPVGTGPALAAATATAHASAAPTPETTHRLEDEVHDQRVSGKDQLSRRELEGIVTQAGKEHTAVTLTPKEGNHYVASHNGKQYEFRLTPEAVAYAQQHNLITQPAPAQAPQALAAGAAHTANTHAPAAASDFPAPDGENARFFRRGKQAAPTTEHAPKIKAGQVEAVQRLLLDANQPIGSRDGKPDHKWGPQTQTAFAELCSRATPPIKPNEVDFTKLEDPTTQRFLQTARANTPANRAASFTLDSLEGKDVPAAPTGTSKAGAVIDATQMNGLLTQWQKDGAQVKYDSTPGDGQGHGGYRFQVTQGGHTTTHSYQLNYEAMKVLGNAQENPQVTAKIGLGVLPPTPLASQANSPKPIEAAADRTVINGMVNDGIGKNEKIVVDRFITDHNMTVGNAQQEKNNFSRLVADPANASALSDLRASMQAAGVKDAQEARGGDVRMAQVTDARDTSQSVGLA